MNQNELRQIIISAIQEIAPELEEKDINPDADLRETCDIDSMDFLNLVIALKKTTGISVPEKDYARVTTLNKMLKYLMDRQSA